jgi:hypothetical protein
MIPSTTNYKTYEALLESIKQHAHFIRRGQGKKSAAYAHGCALLAWANAYDVAGPRPIEPEYPELTSENALEIGRQMKQHQTEYQAWEARVEAALGETYWQDPS